MLSRSLGQPAKAVRGFTLVEMAVTLVVLALVMATAMPYAADWIRDLRLRGVAESLRTGLDKARLEALKGNKTMTFWLVEDTTAKVPGASCVLSSSGLYWVVSEFTPEGKCDAAVSSTADPRLAARSGAVNEQGAIAVSAVDSAGTASDSVTFTSLGQVSGTGVGSIAQLTVSRKDGKGRRLRVMVETGGSVRTCDPAVGSTDPRACP